MPFRGGARTELAKVRGPTGAERKEQAMRRSRYERDHRREPERGYDRGWREEMAYGRAPGIVGPAPFTPFGWDPMMRWGGWDPMLGYVPYQDTPREWAYGLSGDARYEHDHHRGIARGYGRDFERGRPVSPRESPLYGRGGDRAVREWARSRGYDVEQTIRPRPRRG
jgi:hypothetical protein